MLLLGQSTFNCAVEAVEPSLLWAVGRADIESLIRRHPEIGLRVMEILGRRLLRGRDAASPTTPRLATRLAALLLREADADGVVVGRSHGDWADWLGTYRDTISQVLSRFRDEGLVVVRPRLIRIVDRTGLQDYLDR
jgi:CRP-like cAMP-binding protein